jgi:hypothetical protein
LGFREKSMQFFDERSCEYNIPDKRCLYDEKFLQGFY